MCRVAKFSISLLFISASQHTDSEIGASGFSFAPLSFGNKKWFAAPSASADRNKMQKFVQSTLADSSNNVKFVQSTLRDTTNIVMFVLSTLVDTINNVMFIQSTLVDTSSNAKVALSTATF